MTRLEVEQITCTLNGTQILTDVSMDLSAPVTVLLGINGAGKTTLLRVLAGTAPAQGGSVRRLGGSPALRGTAWGYTVGYLPQNPQAASGMNVHDYLDYFGYLKGMKPGPRRRQVAELLDLVGLGDRSKTLTTRLSGGQMRRLGLAAAVLDHPDLVLLDEPTVGLDPEQRLGMRSLVQEVSRTSTILLSTHLAEDAAKLADSLVVLHGGSVVTQTTPADLAESGGTMTAESLEKFFLSTVSGASR